MSAFPLITTIIPTYKRPHLLKKAIDSVLSQNYPHFELFICDNASGDETASIATEYSKRDSRIKYHCHPDNIGMIENYKYGLSLVQSEYFSLLSDDDVLLPWFYQTALAQLIENPQAGFFAGSTIQITSKRKIVRVPLSLWKKEGLFLPPKGMMEMIGKYPVPTGILFRNIVLEQIKIDEKNTLTWDCDYLLHAAARFPIITSKKPCALFLQHRESYSFSQNANSWQAAFHRLAYRVENCFSLSPHTALQAKNRILNDLYKQKLHEIKSDESSSKANQRLGNSCIFFKCFLRPANLAIFLLQKIKHQIMLIKLRVQYQKYCKFLK